MKDSDLGPDLEAPLLKSGQIFWLLLAVVIGFSCCGTMANFSDGIRAEHQENTRQICLKEGHSPGCCTSPFFTRYCKDDK